LTSNTIDPLTVSLKVEPQKSAPTQEKKKETTKQTIKEFDIEYAKLIAKQFPIYDSKN